MKKYRVYEGNTGVLELLDEKGSSAIYQPDCDLDKAQALLYEFYELEADTGRKVKDAFQKDGIDWFPTSISMLYWQFFLQYVKYRTLVDAYLDGNCCFEFGPTGRFSNLITALNVSHHNNLRLKEVLRLLYHGTIQLRNRLVTRKKGDILFFRYGADDFRTNDLLQSLSARYKVTQVTNVPVRSIARYLLDTQLYIVTASPAKTDFKITLPDKTAPIFKAALHYAQSVINSHAGGYLSHAKVMRKLSYRLFFGIDDANIVYPLLYAAKDTGIRTLGIQHGSYERRHEAYILHGIGRYQWYDNVLVWGEYWKKVIQMHSKLFPKDFHILASNKHSYDYRQLPKKGKGKTVLIPYEFLSDSIKVGQYIRQFLAKDFRVYFKPRSDEATKDQIDAYYLGDCHKNVEIIERITPEVMAEVDVIAGTQTTLLFDLMPYQKPVWILETSFRLMYDMVQDGFARLIKEKDMERIDEIYQEDMNRKQTIDLGYIFGTKPVTEAVEDYLAATTS